MKATRLADPRFLGFHILFLTVGGLLLTLPASLPMGWRLFSVGVTYNLAFPIFAASCAQPRWIRMWGFLFPLSLLLILPDWHLAQNLETLVFPDLGFEKIGPVSLFMGLLWVVPLMLIVDFAARLAERFSSRTATLGAAGLSLLIFTASEATLTLIPAWQAQNVTTIGPVALYVLLPEAILGAVAWRVYQYAETRAPAWGLAGAVAVMGLYTAALHVSWWILES